MVYEIFLSLVRSGKTIIYMDAFLTAQTINILEHLQNKEMAKVINNSPVIESETKTINILNYTPSTEWKSDIIVNLKQRLESGESVVCCVSSY